MLTEDSSVLQNTYTSRKHSPVTSGVNSIISSAFPPGFTESAETLAFTRGNWDKVNGYMHAWAVPAAEAEAQPKAEAFTKELKERGAKEWTKEEAAAAMKEK